MKAIEIEGLTWKYSGKDAPALKNINLSIEENTFVGIIGSNESGKTTLVSCIKGIIPENYSGVYKGDVKLFGKSIKECSAVELARTVGMVFSDPDAQFTSMSVEEEIAFGLENMGLPVNEIKERIRWVSELTSIEGLLEKPPYDLSGGQKQRIAIASILAMKPRIIILDEPTSMLDPFSKDNIFNLLQKMKEELKVTILVVEHNIEKIAELADRIILVSNGEMVRDGESDRFFNDIEFIESHSIRIPEAIKFIQRVYKEKGITENCPVKLDEIKKMMEKFLDLR